MQLIRYLGIQAARLVIVVTGVAILNFVLIHSAPGDPAMVLAGETGAADADLLQRLRAEFGLDQPLHVQLFHYLGNIAQFDLGMSYRQNLPVAGIILDRLPATLYLTVPAFILSLLLGISWGRFAAQNDARPRNALFIIVTAFFNAAPVFWIALLLVMVLSNWLGWFPAFGIRTPRAPAGLIPSALDILHHAVLPVLTLSLFYIAVYARLMRSSVLEVRSMDFVKTARAKGASLSRIRKRHITPNALLPVVALAGLQAGQVLGGSVVVETVFAWPGIGSLAFDSLLKRDYPVLMGILLISSIVVVIINVITDLLVAYIDPRIGASS